MYVCPVGLLSCGTQIEKENEGVFLVAEERARGTEETWKEVSGVHNEDYVAFLRYVVGACLLAVAMRMKCTFFP